MQTCLYWLCLTGWTNYFLPLLENSRLHNRIREIQPCQNGKEFVDDFFKEKWYTRFTLGTCPFLLLLATLYNRLKWMGKCQFLVYEGNSNLQKCKIKFCLLYSELLWSGIFYSADEFVYIRTNQITGDEWQVWKNNRFNIRVSASLFPPPQLPGEQDQHK